MKLVQRQIFGNKSAVTYNTYIGGVSATISTASALATKLGISVGAISNFTIDGSDVKCKITGTYGIPTNAFSLSEITYFNDEDGLVTSLGTDSFKTSLLKWVYLKNATSTGPGCFADGSGNIRDYVYIPNCTNLGGTSGNTGCFDFGLQTRVIYANPALATNNAGAPDGDLAYAVSQGVSVRYVTNFTPPSEITTLAAGNVYNTAIQLNFTAPSTTNAIDFYELYVNGVYSKRINSGDYVIGLTPSTSYDFTVYAIDIFYNKSLISNTLTQSTSSASWDISTNLVSYYKMNSDSKDNFRTNNGTNTSITYTTGKIGNASTYNGSSSIVTVADDDNLSFNNATNDLPFSLSYWIYASNTQFSIINKSGGSTREFECQYESGHINFRLISGGNVSNRLDQNYTMTINTGNWIHVVHTYDGSGSSGMKTYVNGTLATSSATTTGTYAKMANTTNPLIFGGITFAGGYFLNGKLDEIAIYNMELTSGNVTSLYNSGSGITL